MTVFALPRRLSRGTVIAGVREQAGPRIGTQAWRSVIDAMVDSRRRKAVRELRKHQAFGPLITVMHVDLTTRELLPFRRED
jgi:hypothetical protein